MSKSTRFEITVKIQVRRAHIEWAVFYLMGESHKRVTKKAVKECLADNYMMFGSDDWSLMGEEQAYIFVDGEEPRLTQDKIRIDIAKQWVERHYTKEQLGE